MADAPTKVVSLRGGAIVSPGEPVDVVIEALEAVLEMARAGEVQGIVMVMMHADDATSTRRGGVKSRAMIGCLEILKLGLAEELR